MAALLTGLSIGLPVGVAQSGAAAAGTTPAAAPGQVSPDCGPTPASIPPIGLPITTLSDNPGGAIVINNQPVPHTADPGGIHITLVDRSSGAIVECGTAPRTVNGVQQLTGIVADFAKKRPEGYLTILSGSNGLFESAAVDELGQLAAQLGVPQFTNADRQWLVAQKPFSLVGSNGWSVGSGFSSLAATGSLSGYLQKNPGSDALGFTFGSFPSFNTSAASSVLSNTVQLGDQMIGTRLTGAGSEAGFQVLIVDRRTFQVLLNAGFPTNCGPDLNIGCDQLYQQALVAALGQPGRYDSNDLVIIQSIGHPKADTTTWNDFANQIDALGGTRGLVNTMNGSQSYALVAVPGSPQLTVESFTDAVTGEAGTIAGVLSQDHLAGFVPSLPDPAAGATSGNALLQLAYQAPTAWPLRDNPADRAAIAYVAKQLDLDVSDPNEIYTSLDEDFNSEAGTVNAMPYPQGQHAFSEADFNAVKTELVHEFRWVQFVHGYFKQLRTILTESLLTNKAQLEKYAIFVKNGAGLADKDPAASVTPFAIYQQLFSIGRALGVPGAGIVSGIFKVLDIKYKQKNTDVLGQFQTQYDSLAGDLADRYSAALPAVYKTMDIITSDYGKLSTAGQNIDKGRPGWHWDGSTIASTERAINLATRRVFAQSLLHAVYYTWRLPGEFQHPDTCRVMKGESADAWMSHVNDLRPAGDGSGVPDLQAWAIGRIMYNDGYGLAKANPQLIEGLFEPISPDHDDRLGLSKLYFMERVLELHNLPSRECNPL